jgi:hypothetical protein
MKAKNRAIKTAARIKDWESNLSKRGPGYRKPGSQKKTS